MTKKTRTRVAICGGSGYTGSELLRLLYYHPDIEVTAITSEKSVHKDVTDIFPYLDHYKGMTYEPLIKEDIHSKADLFLMALPHTASQEAVNHFYQKGKKVIDLSADYRLRDPDLYEQWYGVKHGFLSTLKKAVYGLPELYREPIREASLVANPGCYPTSVILSLHPAIKHQFINTDRIIIDSKSGTTGAGRKPDISLSFSEVNEGFRAYSIATHRHTPEIEQELSRLANKEINVNFTPHLLPVRRGILSTIYADLNRDIEIEEILDLYRKTYRNEPFIRILEKNKFPDIKHICGTNLCEIGIAVNRKTKTLIVISAIDNLVKGASGQAIQNMNIMLGMDETTALKSLPLLP